MAHCHEAYSCYARQVNLQAKPLRITRDSKTTRYRLYLDPIFINNAFSFKTDYLDAGDRLSFPKGMLIVVLFVIIRCHSTLEIR